MANKGWDEFEIGAMLRSFDGKIDDVFPMRKALSPTEARALMLHQSE